MGMTTYLSAVRSTPTLKATPVADSGRMAVIVAAFNAEKWLPDCLTSVHAQRLPSGWEMDLRIGVDGCPATASLLDSMGQPYFYSDENVGTYVIRNSLMAVAPADAWAIFDADDIMLDGYLVTLLRLAGSDGIAGSGRTTIDAAGKVVGATGGRFSSGVCVVSDVAMKRLGGYRPDRIASDVDLIGRAKIMNLPIGRCDQHLYQRRIHRESLTQAKPTRFGSRPRMNIASAHKRLRDAGAMFVEPVTAPLALRGSRGPT